MNLVNSGRLALALQLAWPPCAPARAAWLACAAFTATLPCLCKGPAPPLHSLPLLSPPFSCSLSQPALAMAMAAIAAERSSSFRCCSRLAATVQPCLCWPSQAPAHPLPYFAASRPSSRARPACSVRRRRGCTWLGLHAPPRDEPRPPASARGPARAPPPLHHRRRAPYDRHRRATVPPLLPNSVRDCLLEFDLTQGPSCNDSDSSE